MSSATSTETTVRLKDICKVTCGMPSSRAKSKDESGKELLAVAFPGILPGHLDLSAFQSILATDRAFESLATPGTILLKSVPPFAAAIVPEDIGEVFVGSNVIILTLLPDAPVSAEYLVAYLNSECCARNFEKLLAASMGVLPMLRTSQVKALSIPVLPVGQRQQLADLFSYTSEIARHLERLRQLEWDRYNTVFFDVVERGA